jgi:hypothetical protein
VLAALWRGSCKLSTICSSVCECGTGDALGQRAAAPIGTRLLGWAARECRVLRLCIALNGCRHTPCMYDASDTAGKPLPHCSGIAALQLGRAVCCACTHLLPAACLVAAPCLVVEHIQAATL